MPPDQITGLTPAPAPITDESDFPKTKGSGEPGRIEEFACLASARAYLNSIRGTICSFADAELVAALARTEAAYQQFPELALECPIGDLLEELASSAVNS